MVGTFYRTPSPDAKPYIDVGSVVEIGDVVCIVEAMKMMNEIRAHKSGLASTVHVKAGDTVEAHSALVTVD
jgi:acetyl-CoA carboxylase biotin carboxyl carrier protein